jgi:hypothetical protein
MLPVTSAIEMAGVLAAITVKAIVRTFFLIAHFLLARTLVDGTPLQHPCHSYDAFINKYLGGFDARGSASSRTKRVQVCTA